MRIVVATSHLQQFGGTETYVLTLAEHLQRLGHDVLLLGTRAEPIASAIRGMGLRCVESCSALPTRVDAIISNTAEIAYQCMSTHADATHIYVAHSSIHAIQVPPPAAAGIDLIVVLNERMRAWVSAQAPGCPVLRLRQPIDLDRFAPESGPPRARRLLMLGNNSSERQRDAVANACLHSGLEFVAHGATTRATSTAPLTIASADIVVGYGRCILEAMACGKAAYVLDHRGGDGWVTVESYPRLEADGFAGQSCESTLTRIDLRADLAEYQPDMGRLNRELVVINHSAHAHAVALVNAIPSASGAARVSGPYEELALMSRTLHDLQAGLRQSAAEAAMLRIQLGRAQDELGGRALRAEEALRVAEARSAEARRDARNEQERALAVRAELDAMQAVGARHPTRVRQCLDRVFDRVRSGEA